VTDYCWDFFPLMSDETTTDLLCGMWPRSHSHHLSQSQSQSQSSSLEDGQNWNVFFLCLLSKFQNIPEYSRISLVDGNN
jgi:hypothetical protein